MHTHTTLKPIGTSYEIICAADRIVPSMLYLLLELHPATTIPITSSEIIASKKNSAEEKVAPDQDADSGITAKPANTAVKIISGAILNRKESDFAGVISSFCKSFNKSAMVCAKP